MGSGRFGMAGKLAAVLAAAFAAVIMLTGVQAAASESLDRGQMDSGRPSEKEDPGSSQGDLEERLIGQFDFEEVDFEGAYLIQPL